MSEKILETRLGTFQMMYNEQPTTRMVFHNTLRDFMLANGKESEFKEFVLFEVTSAKSSIVTLNDPNIIIGQNEPATETIRVVMNAATGNGHVFSIQVIEVGANITVMVDDDHGRYAYMKEDVPKKFMFTMSEIMEASNRQIVMDYSEQLLTEALASELHSHTSELSKAVQAIPSNSRFDGVDSIEVRTRSAKFEYPYIEKLKLTVYADNGEALFQTYYEFDESNHTYVIKEPVTYSATNIKADMVPLPEAKEMWFKEFIHAISDVLDGIIFEMQKSIENTKRSVVKENELKEE